VNGRFVFVQNKTSAMRKWLLRGRQSTVNVLEAHEEMSYLKGVAGRMCGVPSAIAFSV